MHFASEIKAGTYACQKDEPAILTLATSAVLVAHEELNEKLAGSITEATFSVAAHLDIEGEEPEQTMQKYLSGVPLHPGAQK